MDDYAYTNARIHAMQGRLLGQAQYESLLGGETFDELIEALKGLPYVRWLEQTMTGVEAAQRSRMVIRIDDALRRDLAQNLSALRHFFSGRSLELIHTLFLRWDIYNLKTVIRGTQAAVAVEDILATTLPVGILDDIALAELARAPTMQAVAGTLETWRLPLARPVRVGLTLLGESDTLQPLEFELDRFSFVHAARMVADGDENDRIVLDHLRFLVDQTNLLTALRYLAERRALSPIEAGRHFLNVDGRLTRTHYESIVSAPDLRGGLSRLAETPLRWLAGAFAEGEPIVLPLIERQLNQMALRKAVNLSRQDPLGIGVAIAYIERKINEIRNLRMIVRGKAVGMSREQIGEWVIV